MRKTPHDVMRLLRRCDTGEFSLTEDRVGDDSIPPYAILSHTWQEGEEVTFKDLTDGTGQDKNGYNKIRFCGQQAERDGLHYFWVDTCCIDKSNYGELQEALNSMFRWYRNAVKCYVYLSDVSSSKRKASDGASEFAWEPAFRVSRWFTRGWTLQELLSPTSVEFFSREWKRLGDKRTLTQQVRKITGIPESALQGGPLSQFSINERLSWIQHRQTKLEEDKAYALLGIFGIYLAPIYGEGTVRAFKRLMDEIDKWDKCVQDLYLTDPRNDKKRIEDTKGGLLKGSYRWILGNADFQRWRDDQQSRLLWIKGDPGKGKTMLLCGIANELTGSTAKTALLSYFFCQATDSRVNSATAVLRGLLYMLVYQQPSLVSHVRKKHDHAGKALFEDTNAWVALSEIFTDVLQDPSLKGAYLMVDALDECATGLPKLLDFIVQTSCMPARVKWIISSRNWPAIEERIERAGQKVKLSLELNAASVSTAVQFYIRYRVAQLAVDKSYKEKEKSAVLAHLTLNANDTFLWVALVCQSLDNIPRWKVLAKLEVFPPGLDALYNRMMQQITSSDDADLCKRILALIATVYRPVTLGELTYLCESLEDIADDLTSVQQIVSLCGSFLTIRSNTVYFVHQSVKDFLVEKVSDRVFPSGTEKVHYEIFSRSLQVMSRTLQRDMYGLRAFEYPAEQIKLPDLDPLATLRYPCIYWIDHLCDWNPNSTEDKVDLRNGGIVDSFLRQQYLYWLEALSLCKSMSKAVVSIAKLEVLMRGRTEAFALNELVKDARRFIMSHKVVIENYPLQTYASALLFSPTKSLIRGLFKREELKWITIAPAMEEKWSPCLQTLEGHSNSVNSVAFSPDSTRLASASYDKTVKIWDASSGECLSTLEGHSDWVKSVAYSPDSTRLASGSYDKTVKIWDVSSGECLLTLEGHSGSVHSITFSPDSTRLTSGSEDNTVKVWDTSSGACLSTLEGHSSSVHSVAFSPDSTRLTSGSRDNTAKIWDASSGACLSTLEDHSSYVNLVAFSSDSTRLASASYDKTVKIWDASSGACLSTLEGHSSSVESVAFSPNLTQMASGSYDNTVKIWDASSGEHLSTLDGHSSYVNLVTFSPDSIRLASGSHDSTVKVWDASSGECLSTLEGHSGSVHSVTFSPDSTRLTSGSEDSTVKVWDVSSGVCLLTLEGHSSSVYSVAFSPDSTRLASGSGDNTVKVWDASSGACLLTLEGHSSYVNSVAFSPDSIRLASGSHDSTVKIWDASSGACLSTLKDHRSSVHSVAFSPDSAQLTSMFRDNTVHQGLGISTDRRWISYDSENILRLPSEYRPLRSVVSKNRIGIGTSHGRVWICNVEHNKLNAS